jgi:hypothetical protein
MWVTQDMQQILLSCEIGISVSKASFHDKGSHFCPMEGIERMYQNIKKYGMLFTVCAMVVLTICCSNLLKQRTIVDKEGIFELTIPFGWLSDIDLHEKAQINVASPLKEAYLILIAENKMDFTEMDVRTHSDITSGIIESNLNEPILSDPVEFEINGNKAIQYQISGSTDNINVTYLHTTVETKNYFSQIVAWSTKSKFESNRAAFDTIIQSFIEKETLPEDASEEESNER